MKEHDELVKDIVKDILEKNVKGEDADRYREKIAQLSCKIVPEKQKASQDASRFLETLPDFILAEYLADCLAAYDKAVYARATWFAGRSDKPGQSPTSPPVAATEVPAGPRRHAADDDCG